MDSQFRCKNEGRRNAVRNPKDADGLPITPIKVNGIDYLEVASTDQKTLEVDFLHDLPGQTNPVPPSPAPELKKENLLIEGGVRVIDIQVESISVTDNILTINVKNTGDFSTYKLRLVTSPTNLTPPPGFDPQLSAVDFSFKVDCPSEFDCKTETECPPEKLTKPEINYLSKDYASFRRLMLDRLSVIMPDWRERNPADLQVALVELLAYVGDHLSYYQDAAATEAYLGTARRRTSVRRHARLLDYFVHEGCNARAWVCLEVEAGGAADGQDLPKGTKMLTRGLDEMVVAPDDFSKVLDEHPQPLAFETMHALTLQSAHNPMSFYTWSDSECCLPRGSTRATLLNDPTLSLKSGDVLIFEEVLSPTKGKVADANPRHRHTVRLKNVKTTDDKLINPPVPVMEIEWHEEDALPFPLCLTALTTPDDGTPQVLEVSVARGNVVLVDHGRTISEEAPVPDIAPMEENYQPRLQRSDISFLVEYKDEEARSKPAGTALVQEPREALPSVTLHDGNEAWIPRRDLLGSDRFEPEFVVEMEQVEGANLRFGDDVLGKKPAPGSEFSATYRVGNGRAGKVGAEAIGRVVLDFGGITKVRNPMPAVGGIEAETMQEVRLFAPQAFRTQERAVTEADWAEVTQRHREVQKAAARFRWTGSWHTVFVTIDRKGGRDVDLDFENEIRADLERYRIAGYDLEIDGPIFVPLDIVLTVCVKPDYFKIDVKETLLEAFSRHDLPNGQRGFFHPDNFTFGEPVYLSKIYQSAMTVAGVASVEVIRFQRWGKKANDEIKNGVLTPAALEIIQLDNDPNFPENGKIAFQMDGGL